jgi:hypothetical protein
MAEYLVQEEMPTLAKGGIALPAVQIAFLEIQLHLLQKALLREPYDVSALCDGVSWMSPGL